MLTEKELSRIKMLRDKALKPVITYDGFYYAFFRHMYHTEDGRTFKERYGEA